MVSPGNRSSARHETLGPLFALKVLYVQRPYSPNYLQRFFREALVAASLTHPSVVIINDVGEDARVAEHALG